MFIGSPVLLIRDLLPSVSMVLIGKDMAIVTSCLETVSIGSFGM